MIRLIKPIGNRKSRFVHPDEVRRRLDELIAREEQEAAAGNAPPKPRFSIVENAESYILKNVPYRGALYELAWSKKLLDKGESRSQDEWLALTRDAEWKLPDAPAFQATLDALARGYIDDEQHDMVVRIHEMLRKDFTEQPYLMTSTKIIYHAEGDDTLFHSYGYANENYIFQNMVGPNLVIQPGAESTKQVEALLGSTDLGAIERAFFLCADKRPRLALLNKRPGQAELSPVIIGCCDDYIDIDAHASADWPARGVKVYKIGETGQEQPK